MSNEIRASDIELILAESALARLARRSLTERVTAFGVEPSQIEFKSLTMDYLSVLFRFPEIDYSARESDMRLRVAMHLACPDAVNYNKRRSEPRWALIHSYLSENFPFNAEESERVARLVACVLDEWDVRRMRGLESRRPKILERQNYRCASCHLDFSDRARIEMEESAALSGSADSFKPYFDGRGVEASMAPEVDHITAVSKDGTNRSDNLQILCALCNKGKGDGSGVRSSRELEYCYFSVDEIPRGHRMALMYYRLKMDRFACTKCGSESNELTVRKHRTGGLIALTNLRSVCYECIGQEQT